MVEEICITSREEQYTELLCEIPDVIFVLSGGVKKVTQWSGESEYISTDYSDSDPYGMLAGKARVDAAAEMSHYFPTTKIVTTSHSPSPDKSSNTFVIHAYVLAHELRQLGVPEENIIFEIKSTDTLTELQEMVKLVARHKWRRVGIITFELHAKRTATMLDHLEELSDFADPELRESFAYIGAEKPSFVIVTSEAILLNINSHYKYLIEHARTTLPYQRRLEAESAGIEAIENRTYCPKGETWKIQSEREKRRG